MSNQIGTNREKLLPWKSLRDRNGIEVSGYSGLGPLPSR